VIDPELVTVPPDSFPAPFVAAMLATRTARDRVVCLMAPGRRSVAGRKMVEVSARVTGKGAQDC